MSCNKNVWFELSNPSSPSSTKETIVELCSEGEAHLTTINNREEWGNDDDLQSLVDTQNSINVVSKLWTIYVIIIIIMLCILFYVFARDSGSPTKYNDISGEPWTSDI